MPADLPVMLVVDGTRPGEERQFLTLEGLGDAAARLDAGRPTLIVIGRVVSLAEAPMPAGAPACDRAAMRRIVALPVAQPERAEPEAGFERPAIRDHAARHGPIPRRRPGWRIPRDTPPASSLRSARKVGP